MIIKKFLVSDMNEAMTRIKFELGKEAVIVSQRKVRMPGFKGYFRPCKIEVTAALEQVNNPRTEVESNSNNSLIPDALKEAAVSIIKESKPEKYNDILKSNENNQSKDVKGSENSNSKNMNNELSELTSTILDMKDILSKVKLTTDSISKQDIEDENNIKEMLLDLDIHDEYLNELQEKYSTKDIVNLSEMFKDEITVFTEDLRGKIALVGPTGVGKTTTIAKLAGRLALVEKKKVGLITIDTYRIGAVEQLRTYAEIMNIPFKVVVTTKEMEDAVKEMEGLDAILIDTTGRSSKNSMQISELRAYIQKASPDHTLLVVSSTTKNRDIKNILKGYGELNYEKTIITKLDETMTYGTMYTIIKETKKPVAYITVGQNVPADIKIPSASYIAQLIAGEESVC